MILEGELLETILRVEILKYVFHIRSLKIILQGLKKFPLENDSCMHFFHKTSDIKKTISDFLFFLSKHIFKRNLKLVRIICFPFGIIMLMQVQK